VNKQGMGNKVMTLLLDRLAVWMYGLFVHTRENGI